VEGDYLWRGVCPQCVSGTHPPIDVSLANLSPLKINFFENSLCTLTRPALPNVLSQWRWIEALNSQLIGLSRAP